MIQSNQHQILREAVLSSTKTNTKTYHREADDGWAALEQDALDKTLVGVCRERERGVVEHCTASEGN